VAKQREYSQWGEKWGALKKRGGTVYQEGVRISKVFGRTVLIKRSESESVTESVRGINGGGAVPRTGPTKRVV